MTAGTRALPRRRGGRGSEQRSETIAAYLFIAIPITLFLILNIGSIFYALYISLWEWGPRGPRDFQGLANYQDLLTDDVFWIAIRNTVYYALVWVPLTMAIGLFLAVIVNAKIRGQTFFRAAFYFPAIASSAAITVLWIFLLSPSGLFNSFLGAIGLDTTHNWLGHSSTAINSIMALNALRKSGTFMRF